MNSQFAAAPAVSVIVTTYNRPDALAAVLRGLGRQTGPAFEVIVADDGSTQETADFLRREQSAVGFPLRHVWQEDEGFRAARARNFAVAAARGAYLVFLDGDCIPFPDFIARHLHLAERGWFVSGNRIMCSPGFTARVLAQDLPVETWSFRKWLGARLRGDIPRVLPVLRFRSHGVKRFSKRRWYGAKSCNLGVWRGDFLRVDGFDESYAGWGHEDADLVARLIASGVYRKSGRFGVPVLHLWHPQSDRGELPENQRRLDETLKGTRIRARLGISAHLQG